MKTAFRCFSAQDNPSEEIQRMVPAAREAERQMHIAIQALNQALSCYEVMKFADYLRTHYYAFREEMMH